MSSLFYIKYKGSTTSTLIRIRNRGTEEHIITFGWNEFASNCFFQDLFKMKEQYRRRRQLNLRISSIFPQGLIGVGTNHQKIINHYQKLLLRDCHGKSWMIYLQRRKVSPKTLCHLSNSHVNQSILEILLRSKLLYVRYLEIIKSFFAEILRDQSQKLMWLAVCV